MSIIPYLCPQIDGDITATHPLAVEGAFARAMPGEAYTGYLDIINQVGSCTVKQIAGPDLPVGHSLSVDGNRIVLSWPAYAQQQAPITNPGFEDLMVGWTGDTGWSVSGSNPITGLISGMFIDKTGEAVMHSNNRYPVSQADGVINAECAVRQGGSSAGNVGAGVCLEYRDSDGNLVHREVGNLVMSGSDNAVRISRVTAMAPAHSGQLTVNIGGYGIRKRQNRALYIDDFTWDYQVAAAGVNVEITWNITLEVTDSTGRKALWTGPVVVASFAWDYTWTTYTRSPSTQYWYDVTRVDAWGYWFAAINGGTDYKSVNGYDWTVAFTGTDYGGYNESGVYAYSPTLDLLMCTSRIGPPRIINRSLSNVPTSGFNPAGCGSAIWVPTLQRFAAAGSGSITMSNDGVVWFGGALPFSSVYNNLNFAYDENVGAFVLVGVNGNTYNSEDGINWSIVGTHNFTDGRTSRALIWSNVLGGLVFVRQQGLVAGPKSGLIYVSFNGGQTWTMILDGLTSGMVSGNCRITESPEMDSLLVCSGGANTKVYSKGVWHNAPIPNQVASGPVAHSADLLKYLVISTGGSNANAIAISNSFK